MSCSKGSPSRCRCAHRRQAPVILMILLGRFEVALDENMGGVQGYLKCMQ